MSEDTKVKLDAIIQKAKEYHDPKKQNDQMVFSWWYDGEWTLEKGGVLYGLRTRFTDKPSYATKNPLPKKFNHGHGCVFVTREEAEELDVLLKGIN